MIVKFLFFVSLYGISLQILKENTTKTNTIHHSIRMLLFMIAIKNWK